MVYTEIEFEWDPLKALTNLRKHGIYFHEVVLVFDDPFSMRVVDSKHSQTEARQIIISDYGPGLVVVVYTERIIAGQKYSRIISARPANFEERMNYGLQKKLSI